MSSCEQKVLCKLGCYVLLQRVKTSRQTKGKSEAVVYFTHREDRKSHKANAAHWSQPKHPAVSILVIITRHLSLSLRKCCGGQRTQRPALLSHAICTLQQRQPFSSFLLPLLT